MVESLLLDNGAVPDATFPKMSCLSTFHVGVRRRSNLNRCPASHRFLVDRLARGHDSCQRSAHIHVRISAMLDLVHHVRKWAQLSSAFAGANQSPAAALIRITKRAGVVAKFVVN